MSVCWYVGGMLGGGVARLQMSSMQNKNVNTRSERDGGRHTFPINHCGFNHTCLAVSSPPSLEKLFLLPASFSLSPPVSLFLTCAQLSRSSFGVYLFIQSSCTVCMHKFSPGGARAAQRSVAANHTGSSEGGGGARRRKERRGGEEKQIRGLVNIFFEADLKVAGLFLCTHGENINPHSAIID